MAGPEHTSGSSGEIVVDNFTFLNDDDHIATVTTDDDQGQQPPFKWIGITCYSTIPYGSLSKFMSLMTAFWAI